MPDLLAYLQEHKGKLLTQRVRRSMANTGISYTFQLGYTPVLSRMYFLVCGSPWR